MTNTAQRTILVVDDDQEIRELLRDYLERNSFQVYTSEDATATDKILERSHVDLIVLDVMLPGEDGFSICRRLANRGTAPIIMLTASADEMDRIVGLELGADDYMAKPFNPRELLARIRAILRRTENETSGHNRARFSEFGDWTLDNTSRELSNEQSSEYLDLSGADYNLLSVFLRHPQQVLSRDQLYDLTRGRESSPFDRSLDVHISRLRQRLSDDAKNPQLIKTVRGVGYVLATPVKNRD